MSPKELLYIEDALGHEAYLHTCSNEHANQLQDPQLRQLAQQLAGSHRQRFDSLLALLK
ncbi:MAG: hypothetical protein VB086_08405 [Clostridiaceae bacterium]|nr:hypothetical protein [Clostridiaceae bacterium]